MAGVTRYCHWLDFINGLIIGKLLQPHHTMEEDAARKAERIKAMLQGYYGAGPAEPATNDARPAASQSMQPVYQVHATVDSPAFDAVQHIQQLLQTSSLERLMVEHRNTSKEIKNLDSDMQQLVYENYNKFISATDTIRAMKSKVDTAVPELEKLKNIMDTVADRSLMVSTKLQKRQDRMEELHRVQLLLKKLQAVFELPKRMRAALEEDVLDTAVSYYAEAQPLLQKYGNRGTFKQIAVDSDNVAKELSQASGVLKRRLAERKDDTERCVLLLRKLGEPDDTLQDRYLAGRAQRLRKVLSDGSTLVEAMAVAAASPRDAATSPATAAAIQAVVSRVDQPAAWGLTEGDTCVPNLRAFAKALDEKLINAVQETVMNVMRFFLPQDLAPEATAAKRQPLLALARTAFDEYFVIVQRAVADAVATSVFRAARLSEAGSALSEEELQLEARDLEFDSDWGADALALALSTASADLGLVSSGLPELGLKERAAELVAGAVCHHVHSCVAALRARVMRAVAAVRQRLGDQQAGGQALGSQGGGDASGSASVLKKGFVYITQLISRGLAAMMQGLRAYEGHMRLLSSWHPQFLDTVQAALHSLFLDLLHAFLATCGLRYDGSDLLREAFNSSSSSSRPRLTSPATGVAAGGSAPSPASVWCTSGPVTPLAAATSAAALLQQPGTGLGAEAAAPRPVPPGLVLLLARVCSVMEQQSVTWVMEALAGAFELRGPISALAAARAEPLPPAFVPGEVARCLSAAAAALLATYLELHGRQLSLMVRRSVAATNWLQHKEPRGPRPVCDLLAERLGRAELEVSQLVEDSSRRADMLMSNNAVRNERGFDAGLLLETSNVERNLAKIFREKVKVFGGPLQFSQVVDSLLDEVVSAGVERAIDPTLLEPAVLDRCLAMLDG
ncbi:hypothetical protein QJQ45_011702 [Haematococcus lacustris]|nr:hypothetical protein QJQ45_011702 [Haematococcus lacustris]